VRVATVPSTGVVRTRLSVDRVTVALGIVFVFASAFYLWTAGTTETLTLHGDQVDPYNRLAEAFLHLHLWVAKAPPELLGLSNPYNPAQNLPIQARFDIHDFALYDGRLYLTWAPAPVIVLLVPLHLLGFSPSSSVTAAVFAIAGLGFALATLRAILRQLGGASLWMSLLAACSLALSSAVPFILRFPVIYEEAIAGGYCFAMAGVWLAASALVDRRASLWRLALMSLAFGLATASRPTLGLLALLLVPVYFSLRATRARGVLLAALALPVGTCLLLLGIYNQARFGAPLEFGARYQLASYEPHSAPLGHFGYVAPGAWFYLASPPRPTVLFPFLSLTPPPVSYPGSAPSNYAPELIGGLLPMAPIVIFLPALVWLWRRRPAMLGRLTVFLMMLAGAGILSMLFLTYEFFSATERYEVDFATPLLLGALSAWLALAALARGHRRRLVQAGGAILLAWGCFTGLAIAFTGYFNELAIEHPGTWATLQRLGSPLSTGITILAGHPVLAEVRAPASAQLSSTASTGLGVGVINGWLGADVTAQLTIVSPNAREAALAGTVTPLVEQGGTYVASAAGPAALLVRGPGNTSYTDPIGRRGGVRRIPLHLSAGINHILIEPVPSRSPSRQLLQFRGLSVADHD
jgi:hypothetical protein